MNGTYRPELAFYRKEGFYTETPYPMKNPATSCFINAVIQNLWYDHKLYNKLVIELLNQYNGDKKGGNPKRRKSKRARISKKRRSKK